MIDLEDFHLWRKWLDDDYFLPPRELAILRNVASLSSHVQLPIYLVGGFVRDLLLKQPVNDFDFVVEGDAIKFGELLVQKFGGKLTTHHKFGTAVWSLPDAWPSSISLKASLKSDAIDLITARSETYKHPGALPNVAPSTIGDDLRRRDFTINAMAVRLDGDHFGELLDPLGGQADLQQKMIRVLHPYSFIDDPTRIFRAIRYEQRYNFTLHPESLALINSGSLSVISALSGERIRHEFDLIFEEENSLQMILRAGSLDIFKWIHPELPVFNSEYAEFLDMQPILDIPASRTTMGYMLWFIDLSEDAIMSIERRLDFSSDLTHAVWAASLLKKSVVFLVNSKPSEWTFALEKLPLLSIYVVYLVTRENALLDYLSIWRYVKPHTTGDDLKSRGLAPGPRFGEILTQLRAAWLDGIVSNENQEKELLNTLL
jgi:tRNA nucleotidyltransferase (CCA-adding enzyme)